MRQEVVFYKNARTGKEPVKDWLKSLDSVNRSRIHGRIRRIELGNWGDFKSIGAGLFEFRFHFGSGYRLYFGLEKTSLILLLVGGNKASQLRGINLAFEYWKKYQEESDHG